LTADFSTWLSTQSRSTSELDLPSLDIINVGLGGLEAHDLRVSVNLEGHLTMIMMGSFEKQIQEGMMIVQMMIAMMLIFDAEKVHEASEEEECNESLVDSNECGRNDGSDTDKLLNVDLEDEIPTHINADAGDDDGKLPKNVWNKMYQNGNMWARNSYGKVSIAEGTCLWIKISGTS